MEMEKLPTEIAADIFSRLPFDSVIHCRCVSKSWFNLLKHFIIHSTDLYFAKLHSRRRYSLPDSVLLLLDQSSSRSSVDTEQPLLHYVEYNEDQKGFNCKVMKKFNCPLEMNSKFWTMATSSNGLICSVYQNNDDFSSSLYLLCIYNPFLGEYVTLPNDDSSSYLPCIYNPFLGKYATVPSKYRYLGMAFGFGHIPSTDEYKVVRIVYLTGGGGVGNVEVYTLGKSTHWSSKGDINYRLQCDSPGVLVNGSIHWLIIEKDDKKKRRRRKKKKIIIAFDLLEEEFRELPLPRGLRTNTDFKIKELDGCLCGIDYRDETRRTKMWKMEDYYMKNNIEEKEDNWKNIFRTKWEGPEGYEHFFFWKKVDQALLWSNSSVVSVEVDELEGPKLNDEDLSSARLFHGILHIKNLVSLTALGEYNTKTVKDDRKRKLDRDKEYQMNKKRKTEKLMKILFGKKPKKPKRGCNSSLKLKYEIWSSMIG